ncbi:SDR family oxidoreductase [Peribacillus muralis]|uniref:SDR family oxidoreductase n=1 Tax=Peribacillus muralis TaxID=264697 RepID=UPI00070996A9|nr:SDR family oxidoreductase [Peribacillus muralis]
MIQNNVWFVTGASKGLGLTLIKKLLTEGFSVAATSRNQDQLNAIITEHNENFLPLQVDLVDEGSVRNAINKTIERFGTIDVVVNNAGFGQFGALEELTDKEARMSFDVNVFGTLNVIRAALPNLRQQRSGHIFNLSSIGGFVGFDGAGIYGATKFAINGLTESLATDLAPFGIKATCVLPGFFRTNFLSEDSVRYPSEPIDAYKEATENMKDFYAEKNGKQLGDPNKATEVFIELSRLENPPVHLFLGSDAHELFQNKVEQLTKEVSDWVELSTYTDIKE